jgi:hypothetical protein
MLPVRTSFPVGPDDAHPPSNAAEARIAKWLRISTPRSKLSESHRFYLLVAHNEKLAQEWWGIAL